MVRWQVRRGIKGWRDTAAPPVFQLLQVAQEQQVQVVMGEEKNSENVFAIKVGAMLVLGLGSLLVGTSPAILQRFRRNGKAVKLTSHNEAHSDHCVDHSHAPSQVTIFSHFLNFCQNIVCNWWIDFVERHVFLLLFYIFRLLQKYFRTFRMCKKDILKYFWNIMYIIFLEK